MLIKRSQKLIFFILLLSVPAVFAQKDNKKDKKAMMTGAPVMWESVNVASFDTLNGPGGEAMKPDLSRIEFIRDEKGGYSTKYRIKDGAGRVWVAKVGAEAQSETAAVRLLAALGYKTEINYLVPELTIPGKGTLKNVRLEARPEDVERLDQWRWNYKPFKGTKELQALKIMMAFFNNWDMKNENNVILKKGDQLQYVISDLGVSFGKTGSNSLPLFWIIGRTRNEPQEYAEADFIKEVKAGKIKFEFNGKNRDLLGDITREDARWLVELLNQLSDKQIEDAFRAANYSDAEVALLAQSVKSRIRALDLATQGVTSAD
ncbi:MAG: hypothetical protein ABR530_07935 [Pyrinomonadaceae bacterium]